MSKKLKVLLFLLVLFFFGGLLVSSFLYRTSKEEMVLNYAVIVGSIIEKHPELEREIISSIEANHLDSGLEVLKKYGLDSSEALEYLDSIPSYRIKFFGSFISFYFILFVVILIYFFALRKKQSSDIMKIDRYLFSLLDEEIKVDLKDFKGGELESLQNDLMKVTSKLLNALLHSNSSSLELSRTLQDISHQLKTPLTSLSCMNDALLSPNIPEEKRLEFLYKQEEVINHMQTLVITLLKVSQIESGMIELKKNVISLDLLLRDALEELDVLIVSRNIEVNVEGDSDISILGDYIWVKEAILNIIKNGVEHSYSNGVMNLKVSENPIYVELLIQDFGSGIKKQDLPHIFERFYKSSNAKDSVGIGLNLSKSIFDRMNATVRAHSKEGCGTTFVIHFYKSVV